MSIRNLRRMLTSSRALSSLTLAVAVSIAGLPVARAQDVTTPASVDELSQMSLEDLLSLDVTAASKKREKASFAPAVVEIITAKEISWLGFNTLEEVLEYAVGVSSINGEGNAFTTTTVRGNTLVNYQTNILLLLDGVPIYSPYHGSFDLAAIPLSSIRQIEIVKGSNSVLYGSNAIGAVIDIRTKEKEVASVKMRAGHYNTLHTETALIKQLGEDWKLSVFFDHTSSEGERLIYLDESGQRLPLRKSLDNHAAIATLGYKDFYLRLHHYERNVPSVKTRGFPILSNDEGRGFPQHERNTENGLLVTAGYVGDLNDMMKLSARATYYDWSLDKRIAEGLWRYSAEQLQTEVNLDLELTDWTSNSVGVVFEHQKARRYKSDVDATDIGANDAPTYTGALYLNGEVKPLEQLSLFYGARYYASIYQAPDDNVVLQNLSPRAAVVYRPHETVALKAIYGKSYRVPTYFEKEVNSAKVVGNPGLDPERSTSYDLAVNYTNSFVNVTANVFHQTIEDKITRVAIPDDPENRRQNQNVGDVTFDGLEVFGKFRLAEYVEGFAGHSWIFRAEQDSGSGDEEEFKYYYKHAFSLGAVAHAPAGVSVTVSGKHLSKWAGADGYYLLNGGLLYQPWEDQKLEFGLQVNNIFDTDIDLPEIARDAATVPTIPKNYARTVFGSISYTF